LKTHGGVNKPASKGRGDAVWGTRIESKTELFKAKEVQSKRVLWQEAI